MESISVTQTAKPKKLGGRPKKSVLFQDERAEILIKLNNILGITDKNKMFYLCDIDNDENKKDQIMSLKDDVVKYFSNKDHAIFRKDLKKELPRPFISLVRSIYKEMKINTVVASKQVKRDGKDVYTVMYFIDM
jgi:hypothetical protein